MRNILLIFILLPLSLAAQEDVLKRIEILEKLNQELLNRQVVIDKAYYLEEKKKLDIAITLGSNLSTKWRVIKKNVALSQGLAQITSINSIGKDNALGFDFTKTLTELVEVNLTSEIDKLKEPEPIKAEIKSRWKENVGKIINNPILQGLVKSNPLTSIASSLITTAIGFTDNKIQTSADMQLTASGGLPSKYKHFKETWKDNIKIVPNSISSVGTTKSLISQEAIEKFTTSLTPYTNLFDQMSASTLRFSMKLEEINTVNASSDDIISNFDTELMKHLAIKKISEGPDRIAVLLKVDEKVELPEYRKVIERAELKDALALAAQYNALKDRVNKLAEAYYQVHIDYFEEYIGHLNTALLFTEDGKTKFDKKKILEASEFIKVQIKTCKDAKLELVKSE